MSLSRARSLACVLLLTTCACSGNVSPGGDDDTSGHPDAGQHHIDGSVDDPDADPGAPDADPGAPDADVPPGHPDASMPQNCGDGPNVPFGSHPHPYASGTIKPNHAQSQLDDAVRGFYDFWKQAYLGDGCGGGRYLVKTGMPNSKTVSEAHGYGMLIAVFMAGYDNQAKTIFDGMYQYYLAHQSANTPFLMAWSQNGSCANNQGPDSATDGDLDIAYALLLADKQWGSNGAIDYHAAAIKIIDAIRAGDVDSGAHWILLGDWAAPGDSQYDATRTSDFIPATCRASPPPAATATGPPCSPTSTRWCPSCSRASPARPTSCPTSWSIPTTRSRPRAASSRAPATVATATTPAATRGAWACTPSPPATHAPAPRWAS